MRPIDDGLSTIKTCPYRIKRQRIVPMTIGTLVGFILFLSSTTICLAGGSEYHDERRNVTVSPHKVTTIKSVVISKNAAWTDDVYTEESPEDCATFKLTQRDVRDYFRLAEQVDDEDYGAYRLPSRCYAAGEISFASGVRGTWRIDFERRGLLELTDGRTFYFFCSKCKSKAFYP